MAIERDMGPGGIMEGQPPVEGQDVLIEELGQSPGIYEFDDGSAIVGEYEEMEPPQDIAFNSNLAEFVDEADLGQISSNLIGDIEDDFSSRQDWEDTYKQGLEFLGMKYEERVEPFEGSCYNLTRSSFPHAAAIRPPWTMKGITSTFTCLVPQVQDICTLPYGEVVFCSVLCVSKITYEL